MSALVVRGDELVTVAVYSDERNDEPWCYRCEPGDCDGNSDILEATVPAVLVDAMESCYAAMVKANRAVIDAAGLDDEEWRLAKCCPSWVGVVLPVWESWVIVEQGSGPARARPLYCCSDRDDAEQRLGELPGAFALSTIHDQFRWVLRDSLRIEKSSYTPTVHPCDRCGWQRDDHPDDSILELVDVETGGLL